MSSQSDAARSEDKDSALRQRALRLLGYRERSRKELLARLGADAAGVVDELTRVGLQDDARFAREWTRSRVTRLHGPLRVRRELRDKGVASDVIEVVLDEAYGEEKERDLAMRAALKHRPALATKGPEGRARTMYSYLVRRGFSPALARELAREEMTG